MSEVVGCSGFNNGTLTGCDLAAHIKIKVTPKKISPITRESAKGDNKKLEGLIMQELNLTASVSQSGSVVKQLLSWWNKQPLTLYLISIAYRICNE